MLHTTVEKIEKSQVRIIGEVPWDIVVVQRPKALQRLGEHVSVDGFRKGAVPENILVQKVGEMAVLEEMAQLVMMDLYAKTITEEKIDAIGRPAITITKIADKSPLGFTITTAVMPHLALPDYTTIAKKIYAEYTVPAVTDTEAEDAMKQLAKIRYQQTLAEKNLTPEGKPDPEKIPSLEKIEDKDVPALTLEDIQLLGNFATMDDLKDRLKHNLVHEKEHQALEKKRIEVLEAIIQDITADIPDILIQHELDRMMAQMEHDIAMHGSTLDEYLAHIKKTKDDLVKDYQDDARKRVILQLVIDTISEKEKLNADPKMLEEEIGHMRRMYKDHKDFDEDRAASYVEMMLVNRAVMEFLEKAGGDIPHHVCDDHEMLDDHHEHAEESPAE